MQETKTESKDCSLCITGRILEQVGLAFMKALYGWVTKNLNDQIRCQESYSTQVEHVKYFFSAPVLDETVFF